MTILEALDHFISTEDTSWWPIPTHFGDRSVLMMAAAVRLSGQLDDCKTESDLREAVAHFTSLLDSDVLSVHEWVAEGVRVEDELGAWGGNIDDDLKRIAESN